MKKKSKIKLKIPRRLLKLNPISETFVVITLSLLLSAAFITMSILEGVQRNIKQNITSNYNSHVSVYATNYSSHNFKQYDHSWWRQQSQDPIQTTETLEEW